MTAGAGFDLDAFLGREREEVERALEVASAELLDGAEPRLAEAVRYSLLAGGKRLRPILCRSAAAVVGGDPLVATPAALAIELIHTYSLVHDDLPCMDDDDLRRGRPTSHKVFGEAIALLAGDALLAAAFELAAGATDGGASADARIRVVAEIAKACGGNGMVGGQVTDISSAGARLDVEALEHMHARKTGALIRVALTSGARLGGGDPAAIEALGRYGEDIGLAFQVADDILDVTASTEALGKTAAKDVAQNKSTFPALMGLEASRAHARELVDEAVAELELFGAVADPLRALATWIVERDR